jgi:hypothetical protein
MRSFQYETSRKRSSVYEVAQGACGLSGVVADAALDTVIRRFTSEFPNSKLMRHAMAHLADAVNRTDDHSFTGSVDLPGGIKISNIANVTISNSISGRTATATREHKVTKYTVDESALQKLVNVQQQIYGIFTPLPLSSRGERTSTWRTCSARRLPALNRSAFVWRPAYLARWCIYSVAASRALDGHRAAMFTTIHPCAGPVTISLPAPRSRATS